MDLPEKTVANFEKKEFTIEGMTCQSCVNTVAKELSSLSGVSAVNVDLQNKSAEILSTNRISLTEVKAALVSFPKYSVLEYPKHELPEPNSNEQSLLKTYKPLIVLFSYISILSLAYQINLETFHAHQFMSHLMAGFFLGLSFFKFLDLNAFAVSFSDYDPLAQRWSFYGFLYPFIEFMLGAMFITQVAPQFANITTIFILTVSTVGVFKKLKSKSKFQCACLGTAFNLPLSNVTIFENLVMVLMAAFALFI